MRFAPAAIIAAATALLVPASAQAVPNYRAVQSFPTPSGFTPGDTPVPQPDGSVSSGRGITVPFPFRLYDVERENLFVHSSGFLMWAASFATGEANCSLPTPKLNGPTVLPFWTDTGDYTVEGPDHGMWTKTEGTAPNRRFIVEWRIKKLSDSTTKRFEVILSENSRVVKTIYFGFVGGGDEGVGVQRGPAGPATVAPGCGGIWITSGTNVDYVPDPLNTTPPSLNDANGAPPRAGDTLNVGVGVWDATESLTFSTQVLRCDATFPTECEPVQGATAGSYTATDTDVNRRLRVRVTAAMANGFSDFADSPATAVVQPALPGGGGGGAGGGGGGGTGDPSPTITKLRVKPSKFRAARRGPTIARPARVTYELSEPATTTFRVQRATVGRRVGGRCVRQTRANRTRPRCTRWVRRKGKFEHVGGIGANRLRFSGRLNRAALPPGSYRLVGVAKDLTGKLSAPATARFKIVR